MDIAKENIERWGLCFPGSQAPAAASQRSPAPGPRSLQLHAATSVGTPTPFDSMPSRRTPFDSMPPPVAMPGHAASAQPAGESSVSGEPWLTQPDVSQPSPWASGWLEGVLRYLPGLGATASEGAAAAEQPHFATLPPSVATGVAAPQLAAKLEALGFSHEQAVEACKRTSSMEAAVEWILQQRGG